MAVLFIFLLGIGNFALHRAVLDSGHPLVLQITRGRGFRGGGVLLAVEFLLLTAAMLLAAGAWPEVAFAYAIYSTLNLVTAWLIVSRRV
ncbi:hypothetical protein EYB45_02975 [Erythrobacteraceae bacterium CFH 75059]|nr:hypothetical protein EYB45_02975 [Erythrobacteraceae bacterium CFH 75059]